MGVKVFFCEETPRIVCNLRRYETAAGCPLMPGAHSYHNAHSDTVAEYESDPAKDREVRHSPADFAADPRWPAACGCGHVFTSEANSQVFERRVVRRADTGEEFVGYQALPIGAVWNAHWMADWRKGPDGRCLICKLPNGHDWMIDSRASNCTMPEDNVHKCWVRHGRPEDGDLHVDKDGHTCAAGGGSIQAGDYHGFLHHGELTA